MGACFAKYPVETKEEMAIRYASYDRIDCELWISIRLNSIIKAKQNTCITDLKNLTAITDKILQMLNEMEEVEGYNQILQSNDPDRIHCALHQIREGEHDPDWCYYKTILGSKCPLTRTDSVA